MTYGCIGGVLGHSYSAVIHERLTGEPYSLRELEPEKVGAFLRAREFRGINVTVPYKQTVIPYLDRVDGAAAAVGAVNTIVNENGRLVGYNTDVVGMRAALARAGICPTGRVAAVLGSGGTSHMAAAVLSALGAGEILRVSRTGRDGCISYDELFGAAGRVEILINTTPVGMFPQTDGCPLDIAHFPSLVGVFDVIYNPLRTRLVSAAFERHIRADGGLYMLVVQAVAAAELFRNTTYPVGTADRIYNELLRERRQTILIGMPSAGKSEVGRHLAAALGRPFFDADAVAAEKTGVPVGDYIRKNGEAAFRKIEKNVIFELTKNADGAVIATGGGSVILHENVNNMRQNGRIYLIDKPLSELRPSDDRPLSATEDDMRRLYKTRRPLYLGAADVVTDGRGSAADIARRILAKEKQTEEYMRENSDSERAEP